MTSTQQFGGGSTKSVKKKSTLPYIIAGALLLFGVGVVLMMMMGKEETPVQAVKLLTQNDLENYVCRNVGDIKLDMKVSFESDTVKNNQCEGTTHVFIVEDSSITEVYTEKILKSNDSADEKPLVKDNPSGPKKIEKMSKKEIKALKVGASVLDEKGEFKAHGFKILVEKQKVKSKESISQNAQNILKVHTVLSGESLNSIAKKYSVDCPKLSSNILIEHNLVSTKFKGDKKKLEMEIIDLGWKIEIPCD
jgi:LysM repeat protein